MHVTYTAKFHARCPVDDRVTDVYTVTIEADEMIKVEDLLAVLNEYRSKAMFQEEITQDLAMRFAECGKVTTSGTHSDVVTVCVVGAPGPITPPPHAASR